MPETTANEAPKSKYSLTGFSVMCAWHFLMIFTAVFNLSPQVNDGRGVWMQLALYFGLAVSYFLIAKFSQQFVKRFFKSDIAAWRLINIAIAAFAIIASLLVISSYNAPISVQVISYALLAFTGSLLIFPWLQLPKVKSDSSFGYRNLAFNMGIGALLAIVISFLQSPIIHIGVCLLPLISTILLVWHWNGVEDTNTDAPLDAKPSRIFSARETLTSNMHFLAFGIAFGFCQGAFAHDVNISFVLNDGLPLAGAVLSALVILFAPYRYLKSYGIFTLQRASMLLFFAGLFLAVFFSQDNLFTDALPQIAGYKGAQILVFAGFNIFEFGFMVFSFAWAVSLKTDFAKFIGYNRSILYFGMGCGLAIGFGLYALAGEVSGFYILAIGGAIVLLTITTLPFFDEFAPYSKIETIDEAIEHEAEMEIQRSEDEMQETEKETSADNESTPHNSPWRERVSKIADECELSERERDVFFYLAKGRNAAYIQQELWISIHTVKTHIANIYRKLGVHSIQEVLDMVDGAPQTEAQEEIPSGKE